MFTHPIHYVVLASVLSANFHVAAQAENASPNSSSANIRRQIVELGSRTYGDREAASQALLDIDVAAIPLLREALASEEAEVRERAKRLLTILDQRDFDLRLSKFARDYDDELKLDLPGWKEYRTLVGEGRDARDFFVRMQRAEQRLLGEYAAAPEKCDAAVAARLTEQFQNQALMLRTNGSTGGRTQMSIESVATIWLIVSDPRVGTSDQASMLTCNAFFQSDAISKVRDQEPAFTLLKHWIQKKHPTEVQSQILNIAVLLELPDVPALARTVLENKAIAGSSRMQAIQHFVRFQKAAALPILEKYLGDETIAYRFYRNRGVQANIAKPAVPYDIQIRDLALIYMAGVCERQANDFDLKISLPNAENKWVVDFNKIMIENETDREAMHKKWNTWWQAHRAEFSPKEAADANQKG